MRVFWALVAFLCFVGIAALAFLWSNGTLDHGRDYWPVFWVLVIGGVIALVEYDTETTIQDARWHRQYPQEKDSDDDHTP